MQGWYERGDRTYIETHGHKPDRAWLESWFEQHGDATWPNGDRPTIQHAWDHCKCLRTLDQARDYFRAYRARKKDEKGLDGEPIDPTEDGDFGGHQSDFGGHQGDFGGHQGGGGGDGGGGGGSMSRKRSSYDSDTAYMADTWRGAGGAHGGLVGGGPGAAVPTHEQLLSSATTAAEAARRMSAVDGMPLVLSDQLPTVRASNGARLLCPAPDTHRMGSHDGMHTGVPRSSGLPGCEWNYPGDGGGSGMGGQVRDASDDASTQSLSGSLRSAAAHEAAQRQARLSALSGGGDGHGHHGHARLSDIGVLGLYASGAGLPQISPLDCNGGGHGLDLGGPLESGALGDLVQQLHGGGCGAHHGLGAFDLLGDGSGGGAPPPSLSATSSLLSTMLLQQQQLLMVCMQLQAAVGEHERQTRDTGGSVVDTVAFASATALLSQQAASLQQLQASTMPLVAALIPSTVAQAAGAGMSMDMSGMLSDGFTGGGGYGGGSSNAMAGLSSAGGMPGTSTRLGGDAAAVLRGSSGGFFKHGRQSFGLNLSLSPTGHQSEQAGGSAPSHVSAHGHQQQQQQQQYEAQQYEAQQYEAQQYEAQKFEAQQRQQQQFEAQQQQQQEAQRQQQQHHHKGQQQRQGDASPGSGGPYGTGMLDPASGAAVQQQKARAKHAEAPHVRDFRASASAPDFFSGAGGSMEFSEAQQAQQQQQQQPGGNGHGELHHARSLRASLGAGMSMGGMGAPGLEQLTPQGAAMLQLLQSQMQSQLLRAQVQAMAAAGGSGPMGGGGPVGSSDGGHQQHVTTEGRVGSSSGGGAAPGGSEGGAMPAKRARRSSDAVVEAPLPAPTHEREKRMSCTLLDLAAAAELLDTAKPAQVARCLHSSGGG
ncbi:hypothetical protein FOA52_015631 [Chlamydomonas sp. UWO 241]|nr:hypothetical protein FOA52_015631 [Chlamydomonas sp. UWO 241]